jgi:hypothetical protein
MDQHWGGSIFSNWEEEALQSLVRIDINEFLPLAEEPELLVNHLDKLLTFGQLSDQTRDNIIPILHNTYWTWNDDWKEERVHAAIYYILVSPDFNVMK